MNLLHEKRRLLPCGHPQDPISAAVAAFATSLGASTAVAGVLGTMAVGATVGAVGAAVTGGNILKGALFGAITAGVMAGVSEAVGAMGNTASSVGGAAEAATNAAVSGVGGAPVSDALVKQVVNGSVVEAGSALAPTSSGAALVDSVVSAPSTGLLQSASDTMTANLAPNNPFANAAASAKDAGIGASTAKTGLLGMGDKTSSALITMGGNALTGMAQGKAQEEMYQRQKTDARFAKQVPRGTPRVA